MPSWPTQSDYKDSLQNPDSAFRDPELQRSQAERSPMGVPRARSGAFASVYKMTGKETVALKLFNFPNEDRAKRYKAVSDYLELTLGPKKPPCLVKFQYHLEGIRVGRFWFPTLTMPWVKGVSLGEWVRQTVERKVPDLAAVRKMAESWVALVKQLQEAKIAHGDLQHDNVMVVGDTPVLVDYDGMCVPALDPTDPKKKLEQLEFGKPAYQHPARAAEPLSGKLDHFSAWVILIALRAIAADPALYVKYVLKPENENLLFTVADIQHPAGSTLWPELLKCKDTEVCKWSRALRESLDKPFANIPPFALDDAKAIAEQAALLDKLKAVAASPGDGRALVKLWDESAPKLANVAEAQKYETSANAWRNRIKAADEFLRAFAKFPQAERELALAWQAVMSAGPLHPMLKDSHRKRGEEAQRWSPLLERLRRVPAFASYANDQSLLAAWGNGSALAGCAEAAPFVARAAAAQARVALVQTLQKAIESAERGGPEDAVVAAAAKLPPGYEHPHEERVEESSDAIVLIAKIQKALDQPYPSDRKVANVFDRLKKKNPQFAARLNKVNSALFAAVEEAVAYRKLFDAFVQIDADEPRLDKQDEKWLALWAEHGKTLALRRDREALRDRLTQARDRQDTWAKLRDALNARDMFALRKCYAACAATLGQYPPLIERNTEIQDLLAKADRVIDIQAKIAARRALIGEDIAFLRENHSAFDTKTKATIEKQVRARLLGDAKLIPAYPAYSITGRHGGLVKACWSWSGHGLITRCIVAVDSRRFLSDPDEADPFSRLNCFADTHQREGGGITIVPPTGAERAYVTIWPVVELGWKVIHGPPLLIGPVSVGSEATIASRW